MKSAGTVRAALVTALAVTTMSVSLAACGSGGGGGSPPASPPSSPPVSPPPSPPPAVLSLDLGGDQTVKVGEKVYLNGRVNNSTCNDPFESRCWRVTGGNGGPVTFDLVDVSQPSCIGAGRPSTSFTAPDLATSQKITLTFQYSCPRTSQPGGLGEGMSGTVNVWIVDDDATFKPSAMLWNRKHTLGGAQYDIRRSAFIKDGAVGAEVDTKVAEVDLVASASAFTTLMSSNVPSYHFTLGRALDIVRNATVIHLSGQFRPGVVFPAVGSTLDFGQDVGFATACTAGGTGWAAPDGACPAPTPVAFKIPIKPAPATRVCRTGKTSIGVLANGVLLRGQIGERSYLNQNVWHDWAPWLDAGNFDACMGHTPAGDAYHHHGYSRCLAQQLNDTGTAHSPIYGYAADGYPIYGPWHANGVRAQSCWKTRESKYGTGLTCPGGADRSCLASNPEDINSGAVAATAGPTFGSNVTGPDGIQINTFGGTYVEDYGFDTTCQAQGPQYLDKHNGHDTGDGLGYHYHMTVDANMDPTFPGGPGPTYAGEIKTGATGLCN